MLRVHTMKVLVLTTTFPRWKEDATPTFVYDLSQQLRKEGLDVVILAPHHQGAKFEEEMEGLQVYRFPYFYPTKYQRLCYEGGVLANLKRSWLARLQVPLLILFELLHALLIARREGISAIHSHWIVPNGLVGAMIRALRGVFHLSTAHAAGVLILDRLPFKTTVSRFVFRHSDAITADGSHVRSRFLEMAALDSDPNAAKKILIQPMGVDNKVFEGLDPESIRQKGLYDGEFIILFVGRFAEKKGIKFLLESVRILASDFSNTRLLLAGAGPLENELRQQAEALNIEEHVTFMGWVTRDRLPELYHLSDVVVVPSIVTSSGDTEGMPTTIAEAMASGRPVIASDVGGIRDVVVHGYNGFLVQAEDPVGIAARVSELIGNPCLRDELSRHAALSARDYDWAVVGRRYADLLAGE
jgi:glycosyltransferase involved in cell wall biosynthesis